MEMAQIGKNIRKWRQFRGKKQGIFAKEIGISRTMLSRYENGRSEISINRLQDIAILLGITLQILIKDS